MSNNSAEYQGRYYRKHKEELRLKHREYMHEYTQRPGVKQRRKEYYRQRTLGTSKGRLIIHKRERPPNDICEVCGKEFKRLDYHHWNEALPELGIWVCYKCHQRAEMVDRTWECLERYLALKKRLELGD